MPTTRSAPPRAPERRVIVSLHDVAPPFEQAIRQQIRLLAAIGVRRVTLKVVPNWHGAAPLHDSPALVAFLRAQAATGCQFVLHGYQHRPQSRHAFEGPWLSRARARLFAADTAEFLTLSADEAEAALRAGLAMFEQCGLPRPTMFCAPGWLHNAAAETALRRVGFRALAQMFALRDLRAPGGGGQPRRIWTPAVGYMGAGPGQELGVQTLNRLVRLSQRGGQRSPSILKVYLHPQRDPTGPRVRRLLAQLERMIVRDGWRPATFADLLDDANRAADVEAVEASGAPSIVSDTRPGAL